jgi:hypothetical protein
MRASWLQSAPPSQRFQAVAQRSIPLYGIQLYTNGRSVCSRSGEHDALDAVKRTWKGTPCQCGRAGAGDDPQHEEHPLDPERDST